MAVAFTQFANLEPLARWTTRRALDFLADRFSMPILKEPYHDCHTESEPERIDEFVAAYEKDALTDDERFALMELILNSAWEALDRDPSFAEGRTWKRILTLLEAHLDLHIYSVWYWASVDPETSDLDDDTWSVAPFMRPILLRHQDQYAQRSGRPADSPDS